MPAVSRLRLLRWIVLTAVVAVLLAIGYSVFVSRVYKRPIPTVRAVIIDYRDAGLTAYDCGEATRYCFRWPLRLSSLEFLGYSHSRDAWAAVYADNAVSSKYTLSVIKPNRSTVIYSGDRSLYSSALCGDVLYVPAYAQGCLLLKCYTLDGKPIGRIRLDIDNVAARFTIAVAPSGLIAAGLVRRGASEGSHIYLFGNNGKLRRRLASGDNPRFGGDGRYLAYKEITTAEKHSVRYTGRITILDLKTKRERSICTARPECSCLTGHASSNMRGYQLSPDGHALICSYVQGWPVRTATQSIYVVDLSNDTPQWYKLPIQVLPGWVVLDKVPRSFVRDCDKN
ncbi:MAG: hypothetical protein QHI38_10600 [Armatimonadota bacterium]|nr:hypothetical protein [Armatimonadota bacterium]